MIEQLLNEDVQFVSTVIECESSEKRDRLRVWLGADRPEFKEEVESEEKEWFEVFDLLPYTTAENFRCDCVYVEWIEHGPTLGKVVRIDELQGISLHVIYLLTEMAGEGGFGDDVEDELGFLIVNQYGKLQMLSQSDGIRLNGYVPNYGPGNRREELMRLCQIANNSPNSSS